MKQKRSPKNKKPITKTTRKVAQRSNPPGRKHREDPKGFAAQSGGIKITNSKVDVDGDIIGRDKIIYEAAPEKFDYLHQLPSPPADFVGRDAELKTLREYMKHGGATICAARGLGGVGKTTLALKLAHDLKNDYPDAQFYLDLRGASDKPLSPSDALAHVIRAYHPTAKLPESEVELRSIYLSALDGKRALVLMDNAKDAKQVEPLIPPSSCLLLVTSRQKFVLPDIRTIDLESLPLDDAKSLLLQIAKRIGNYAEEIAELCGKLPLALRLAGSALAEQIDLEPTQYVKRLGDKKNRLQLIEASFSLSYDLLTKKQQKLWRMLAIFPSSFEYKAANAVWTLGRIQRFLASLGMTFAAARNANEEKAQDSLGDFVRYSILAYDPATKRYALHDLAKVFADSRLSEKEKYEAGLRHATHYKDVLSLAERLYLKGNENITQGLKLYNTEVENIQHGQAWASVRVNENDAIAQVCNRYAWQWSILNLLLHPRIYIGWIESALVAARKLKNKQAESGHLGNLGLAYSELGETRRAIELYDQGLKIQREIGDKHIEGAILGNLGLAYSILGEARKAIEFYQQALKIMQEIGDKLAEGSIVCNLGLAYSDLGEISKATEFYEQALKIGREIGARRGEGQALGNLGLAYSNLGETRKAIEFHEQALKISSEIGDRHGEGHDLANLGNAYSALGETHKAIEFYEQSLKIAQEIGDKHGEGSIIGNLGLAYEDLGETRKAIEFYEQALKIMQEIGDKRAESIVLGNLGVIYCESGDAKKSIESLEEKLTIAREIGARSSEGNALNNLGEAYLSLGEIDRAISLHEQAKSIAYEIGNRREEGEATYNLALALTKRGERAQAIRYAESALKIYEEIEYPQVEKVRKQLEEWKGEKH
ncbi:MAG: tetratricopeptide repeat protein [Chloroflexi bacterium]|nr:tetratricopeptide repeat protein [Chloroflexota bacterium]MBI5714093.1 tetratricopeptide repeat protein [Chloroflexota bacterium]